jgi:phosphatidylglycerophosphate synthase
MSSDVGGVVVVNSPVALERFCGRTLIDRHLEALGRAGVARLTVVTVPRLADAVRASIARAGRDVPVLAGHRAASDPTEPPPFHLVVSAESVFDPRLYAAAIAARAPVAVCDEGEPIGLVVVSTDEVQRRTALDVGDLDVYSRELRRPLRPFWMRVKSTADRAAVRAMLVAASGKGHLEAVAHLIHRPIEAALMQRIAEWRLSPNQITLACNLVAYLATALLAMGHLLTGTLAAMAVGIIDGLDGRQARVQLRTSAFGRVEHVFDKIYEILWIVALAYALSGRFAVHAYAVGLWWWIAAYLADTGAYDLFKLRRGVQLDEASPVDASIRFVAGRRNMYTYAMLVGVVLGRPHGAFWFIVAWAVATAMVHWMRVTYLLATTAPASRRTAYGAPARR